MSRPANEDLFRFRLWHAMVVVTALSILCATVPGAAIVIVGGTPVAVGFILFVIADQKNHEGLRLLGAVVMALGLFLGAFAMAAVSGLGG